MSILMMSEVWAHAPYRETRLLVLLAFADFADDEGVCWPSQATVAKKARCHEETVRRAVKRFVDDGWLVILEPHGSHRSARCQVTPLRVGIDEVPLSRVGTIPTFGRGEPSMNHQGSLQKGNEVSVQRKTTSKKSFNEQEWFEFWRAYPRKAGKQAALKAWHKAITQAEPHVIIAAAARFRDDPNREDEFTPHPSTWLNQHRWEDDPLPRRRGKQTAHERRQDNTRDLLAYAAKKDQRQRKELEG